MNHNNLTGGLAKGLRLLFAAALVVGLSTGALPAPIARAAGFTVNTTADTIDANPGDGTCADTNGDCSLRAAIMEANALPGLDTITLPAGIYNLTIPGADEDAAATGDLDITDDLTLIGAGADVTVVDGSALDRVFDVSPDGAFAIEVTLSGVTVRNGSAFLGGGVLFASSLTVSDAVISGNSASRGGGLSGSISGTPVLTMTGSTVSGNTSGSDGAGIHAAGGNVITIIQSTIADNTSMGSGGAMDALIGDLTLDQVTITGNSAALAGGAIRGACMVINNSTVSNNSANAGGAILRAGNCSVTITDSTVSGNRSVFQGGGISSGGGNLTISKTTFADNQAGDAGGAIFVEGMLNVYSSAILNNSASEGGGIHIEGDAFMPTSEVMILGSRISGNTATGDGGGISSNSESNITINGSTLNDNIAGGDGGGVRHGRLFNVGGGTVAVVNSTLSGNTAGGFGGGVDGINGSLIDLRYTTLAFNAANFGGSLGTFAGSSSRAEHTIFANSVGADECSPGLGLSLGHNLASDDSCNLFLPTDIENADPLLEPLADNGGSTPTHALLPGSPAIDAGVSNPVTCLSFDQRGVFRPLDGDGDLMAACDVGAYEAPPPPIDDFTSADHPMGQLGPNWRGAKSPHSYRVVDDMLDVEEGGPVYWHRDTFGPDQQAFVTLAKVDPNGQHHSVLLKAQDNARGLPDWRRGAVAVFYDAVTQQVGVESYVPGRGWRVEGVRDSIVLKDGDQLGGRVKSGATAVVFVNGSFLFETSIDPFFDGKGGRIGLWFIVAADAVLDDFSGATVAP